jgi:hypothetical protein
MPFGPGCNVLCAHSSLRRRPTALRRASHYGRYTTLTRISTLPRTTSNVLRRPAATFSPARLRVEPQGSRQGRPKNEGQLTGFGKRNPATLEAMSREPRSHNLAEGVARIAGFMPRPHPFGAVAAGRRAVESNRRVLITGPPSPPIRRGPAGSRRGRDYSAARNAAGLTPSGPPPLRGDVLSGAPRLRVEPGRALIKPPTAPIEKGPFWVPFQLAEREGFEPSMGF